MLKADEESHSPSYNWKVAIVFQVWNEKRRI